MSGVNEGNWRSSFRFARFGILSEGEKRPSSPQNLPQTIKVQLTAVGQ